MKIDEIKKTAAMRLQYQKEYSDGHIDVRYKEPESNRERELFELWMRERPSLEDRERAAHQRDYLEKYDADYQDFIDWKNANRNRINRVNKFTNSPLDVRSDGSAPENAIEVPEQDQVCEAWAAKRQPRTPLNHAVYTAQNKFEDNTLEEHEYLPMSAIDKNLTTEKKIVRKRPENRVTRTNRKGC